MSVDNFLAFSSVLVDNCFSCIINTREMKNFFKLIIKDCIFLVQENLY